MLNAIAPLLNRLIPAGIAFKGLQKINPKIGKFLTSAITAGYTADQAVDFLRGRYEDSQDLKNGRPDERAAQASVRNSREIPELITGLAGGAAGGIGASLLMGGDDEEQRAIRGEVLPPIQNQKSPLALPGVGQAGYESQVAPPNPNQPIPMGMKRRSGANDFQESTQQNLEAYPTTTQEDDPYSLLATYDPRLAEGIRSKVEKGWDISKMNEIAHLKYGAFAKPIARMENDYGKPFVKILKDLFSPKKRSNSNKEVSAEFGNQPTGQGAQALQQVLSQIMRIRGQRG